MAHNDDAEWVWICPRCGDDVSHPYRDEFEELKRKHVCTPKA